MYHPLLLFHALTEHTLSRDKMPDISDIFKFVFLNENIWISINVSLEFVPKGPINNIPASILIMAWKQPSDKPLSKPMMVSLLMYTCICITRSASMGWFSQINYCRSLHGLQISVSYHTGLPNSTMVHLSQCEVTYDAGLSTMAHMS